MTIWRHTLWRYRLTTAGIFLTLFGLATALNNPPIPVSVAAAVAGSVVSTMEIWANRRRSKALRFQPRDSDTYRDVVSQSEGLGAIVESGHHVGVVLASESGELRKRPIRAFVQTSEYKLPRELRNWSLDFLARRARTARIYNDLTLGLASDLLNDDIVTLRSVRYFDFICSNLLAPFDISEAGRRGLALRGRDLILDRHGRLLPFRRSRLANTIGISTLAFTTDGKLLVTAQTSENVGSPGLLAPSGSGALEPQDVPHDEGDLTLQKILINGAQRELREECNLEPHEVGESLTIGHGRWISRGAMPEFCTVTLLHLTSDQALDRDPRRIERPYVHETMAFSLTSSNTWDPRRPLEMLPRQHQLWASWPLAFGLACLAECMNDESWPLRSDLLARLDG